MKLILCSTADNSALWLHHSLVAAGMEDLELITQEVFALALGLEHRLGEDGAAFTMRLADGREIDSRQVEGTVNRVSAALPAHLDRAEPKDREYATQEFAALFMSLLEALPDPVLNRPTSQGLSGPWRHPSEWVWLASQAGIPIMPYVGDSLRPANLQAGWQPLVPTGYPVETVFVVGNHVVGPGGDGIHEGCRSLAKSVGVELLGVDLVRNGNRSLVFAGANPTPELERGGRALVEAVKSELTKERSAE